MKFLHLIWRNALRNRMRTGLTMAGIGFLIFVLIFIMTSLTEIMAWEGEAASHQRVVVQHSLGLSLTMPIEIERYLKGDEIARHAEHVLKLNWYGAYWQDPKNFFANFAIDIEPMRALMDDLKIPDAAFEELQKNKTGAIVGESLMKRYGWKVGQRITLIGTFYPANPELDIVGTFKAVNIRQEEQLFFRWDYFDELMGGKKMVGTWWMKARTPEDVPKLKELIDHHTRNSSDPTETVTEKEFAAQFMQMMGNIKGIVGLISGVVLLIMVMMTANTMAMSVRERVTEVAVMRTLGFTSGRILFLIIAESVMVSLFAALGALGGSLLIFNVLHLSPSPLYFPIFLVEPVTMAAAIGGALFCGVASAAVPAFRASRRKISDGLRQVV
jgi:putative ABC transport system permease protein